MQHEQFLEADAEGDLRETQDKLPVTNLREESDISPERERYNRGFTEAVFLVNAEPGRKPDPEG